MTSEPIFSQPLFSDSSASISYNLNAYITITNITEAALDSICKGLNCTDKKRCARWRYVLAADGHGGAYVAAIAACWLKPRTRRY